VSDRKKPADTTIRWLFLFANDRIWTPPRAASSLIDNDKVRRRTYIRPLELAYVDAGP